MSQKDMHVLTWGQLVGTLLRIHEFVLSSALLHSRALLVCIGTKLAPSGLREELSVVARCCWERWLSEACDLRNCK